MDVFSSSLLPAQLPWFLFVKLLNSKVSQWTDQFSFLLKMPHDTWRMSRLSEILKLLRFFASLFLRNGLLNAHLNLSAECPSTLSSCEELMLRLEQMQALLKTEPEEADDEIVDIVTMTPPCQKLKVKEEEQEADTEPKFFLGPCVSAQFVGETAQQVRSSWYCAAFKCWVCLARRGFLLSYITTPLCLSDRGDLPASGGGEECVCSRSRGDDSEGRSPYKPYQTQHTHDSAEECATYIRCTLPQFYVFHLVLYGRAGFCVTNGCVCVCAGYRAVCQWHPERSFGWGLQQIPSEQVRPFFFSSTMRPALRFFTAWVVATHWHEPIRLWCSHRAPLF